MADAVESFREDVDHETVDELAVVTESEFSPERHDIFVHVKVKWFEAVIECAHCHLVYLLKIVGAELGACQVRFDATIATFAHRLSKLAELECKPVN